MFLLLNEKLGTRGFEPRLAALEAAVLAMLNYVPKY